MTPPPRFYVRVQTADLGGFLTFSMMCIDDLDLVSEGGARLSIGDIVILHDDCQDISELPPLDSKGRPINPAHFVRTLDEIVEAAETPTERNLFLAIGDYIRQSYEDWWKEPQDRPIRPKCDMCGEIIRKGQELGEFAVPNLSISVTGHAQCGLDRGYETA